MGRGGGSSGGHGGSGGHMHYGSSRGGGSSSHHSSGGGSHYHGVGRYYGGRSPVIYYNGCSLTLFFVVVLIMLIIVVCKGGSNDAISASTHVREKLPASMCETIDTWYEDDIDWIHDEKTLLKGLKKFYDETGVQPYLYVTDNINGKAKPTAADFENVLQRKYSELFEDQGHILVCFLESSPDVYATYYVTGSLAKNVIDEEGGEILLDYFDYYYTSDKSDEEMFADSFSQAATRMMTLTKTQKQAWYTMWAVFGICAAVIGGAFFLWKRSREKAKQAVADAQILNADISEESDPLLDKYTK